MVTLFGNHKITQTLGACLPCLVRESLSAPLLHPEISVCLQGWSRPWRKANSVSTTCQYPEGFHSGADSLLWGGVRSSSPKFWFQETLDKCTPGPGATLAAGWWGAQGAASVSTALRTRQAHPGTHTARSFPAGRTT